MYTNGEGNSMMASNSTQVPAATNEEESTTTMDILEYVDRAFFDIKELLVQLTNGQTRILSELPKVVKGELHPNASTLAMEKVPDTEYGRYLWDAYNPVLVADALFSIAKVASFLRMISLTVVNKDVGPMQISLGGMITDISKFLFIFCFVWFAFSLGMNQLYWYYAAILPDNADYRT